MPPRRRVPAGAQPATALADLPDDLLIRCLQPLDLNDR